MSTSAKAAAQSLCPVGMSDGEPCDRPLHRIQHGDDEQHVCLMHTHDPDKDWTTFWQEIQAILKGTSARQFDDKRFDFSHFVFTQNANFSTATFTQEAYFRHTTFNQVANFSNANFTYDADFKGATFTGKANFLEAKFTQRAGFYKATFTQDADFIMATFGGTAHFVEATCEGALQFQFARILSDAQVQLHRVNETTKGVRIRLRICPLEGFRFEDVNWHREKGRLVLQDELDQGRRVQSATHELVADAYRRLVNNFEENRQYELAEECVIGEMEMRRRNPKNPLADRAFLWLYRLFSLYGSSYRIALGWVLAFLLVVFPSLFGYFGLRVSEVIAPPSLSPNVSMAANAPDISWLNAARASDRRWELWQTYKAGLLASLEVATFQRNASIVPATTRGRGVAVAEVIVIPGQLALLLLALRRRFRR